MCFIFGWFFKQLQKVVSLRDDMAILKVRLRCSQEESLWTCWRGTTLSSWLRLRILMLCLIGWCSVSVVITVRSSETSELTQGSLRGNGSGFSRQLLRMLRMACPQQSLSILLSLPSMSSLLHLMLPLRSFRTWTRSWMLGLRWWRWLRNLRSWILSLWEVMMKQHQIHPQMLSPWLRTLTCSWLPGLWWLSEGWWSSIRSILRCWAQVQGGGWGLSACWWLSGLWWLSAGWWSSIRSIPRCWAQVQEGQDWRALEDWKCFWWCGIGAQLGHNLRLLAILIST